MGLAHSGSSAYIYEMTEPVNWRNVAQMRHCHLELHFKFSYFFALCWKNRVLTILHYQILISKRSTFPVFDS